MMIAAKDKEPLKIRPELLDPARLSTKVQQVHATRARVIDVIAHEAVLLVLATARMYSLRPNEQSDTPDVPRIGILGGGNVGCAIAMKLLEQYNYPAHAITISTRQPDRITKCDPLQSAASLALFQSISRYYDNTRLSRESDILILCMPPSQLKSVAIQIKHSMSAGTSNPTVLISVLCGAVIENLQKACGTRLVTRTMVNVSRVAAATASQDKKTIEVLAAQELAPDTATIQAIANVLEDVGVCFGMDSPVAKDLAWCILTGKEPLIPSKAWWNDTWEGPLKMMQQTFRRVTSSS